MHTPHLFLIFVLFLFLFLFLFLNWCRVAVPTRQEPIMMDEMDDEQHAEMLSRCYFLP